MSRYRRDRSIEERAVDSSVFITQGGAQPIHELNAHAAAIWRLLAKPLSEDEIVTVFASAFPDQPTRRLRTEIRRVLAEMVTAGYVERVD